MNKFNFDYSLVNDLDINNMNYYGIFKNDDHLVIDVSRYIFIMKKHNTQHFIPEIINDFEYFVPLKRQKSEYMLNHILSLINNAVLKMEYDKDYDSNKLKSEIIDTLNNTLKINEFKLNDIQDKNIDELKDYFIKYFKNRFNENLIDALYNHDDYFYFVYFYMKDYLK